MSIYFDYAATSPMFSEAISVMVGELSNYGNSSSLHSFGRQARSVVEQSRELVARACGAEVAEIVFTSGGTEANNLALKGFFWERNKEDSRRDTILVSAIEHHSVVDAVLWLQKFCGANVVWIPVDFLGRVDIDFLADNCKQYGSRIVLISVMLANNEVGTIQDVRKIVDIARMYDIPVHSDVVQGFGHVSFDFVELGLAAASISSHKMGGAVGAGALVLSRNSRLVSLFHGGGQERAVRAGTLAVPNIASFGVAADIAVRDLVSYSDRLLGLCSVFIAGVREKIPDAVLRGPEDLGLRLPGNVHFTFPGCDGETLLFLLDQAGVSSSTGAACNAGVVGVSHVLLAMGLSEVDALGAQRFSLGYGSTLGEAEEVLRILPEVVLRAKNVG